MGVLVLSNGGTLGEHSGPLPPLSLPFFLSLSLLLSYIFPRSQHETIAANVRTKIYMN